jgi:16S rRNA (adenine1518-N6/adenine1519-N6)-dimethyltransferase
MKAKKSLGQNFLKSQIALQKIIEVGEIKSDDVILEIGPGRGMLTVKLLERAGLVIAVEKDRELFEFLKFKFEKEIKSNTFVLVREDILKFDIDQSVKKAGQNILDRALGRSDGDGQRKFSTGAILKKFLTEKNQPERMVLMVQHEVAERIMARDGKESILSISVKAYGKPKKMMKVPARYFSPSPKVDSAIIAINNISRKTFEENQVNEEKFWEIVRAGFAHKRKKLSSNLKSIGFVNLASAEIMLNKRAEDLSLSDWISLTKAL